MKAKTDGRWHCVPRVLLIWMAVFASTATVAQHPLTLDECVGYALRNNKNITNAKFDQYIAQKQVKEFKSIGLPQVKASANFQQYGDFPVSLIDIKSFPGVGALPADLPDSIRYATAQFGVKYNASAGGQVSQLIFDGSFFVGLKAAAAYADLMEIGRERTEIETMVAVTKSYYSALVNGERVKLLHVNLDRLNQLLTNTEAMYKEGFVEKVDVDRLRIARNNLRTQAEKAERFAALGYDLLKFQMGMPIENEIMLAERITQSDQLPALETLAMQGNFQHDRIEMQLMEQQANLHKLNITRYRMGIFGTMVGVGNFNYQTYRPRFFDLDLERNWFKASFVGLSYNVTLFDGMQKRARVQMSQLEIAKVRNNMDMFTESVKLELRAASTGVMNAWADVETARENKDLAEEVQRISTTKYKEGVGSNLEVIDAENTLMNSQINYLSALYEYRLANVELQRVKGEIKPSVPDPQHPKN